VFPLQWPLEFSNMANLKKVKGIHLPNRPFKNRDEWERIKNLGCSHVVDLDLFRERWGLFAQGIDLHVRIWDINCSAEYVTELIDNYPQIKTIRVGNEVNVETTLTPQEWFNKLMALCAKLPRRVLDKFSIAAPSPGLLNYYDFLQQGIDVATYYNLKYIDAHVYGNAEQVIALLDYYRSTWGGSVIVTEYNFGAGNNYTISNWCADYVTIMKVAALYVDAFCIFIWQWDNPNVALPMSVDVIDTALEKVIPRVMEISMYEDYTSPNNSGKRPQTKVIELHGTRSGRNDISLHQEFTASVAWHFNPNSDASCHCIVGQNEIAFPVREDLQAWGDWEYNKIALHLEMVQPTVQYVIPQQIQRVAARQVALWCIKYNIPVVWSVTNGICEHRETPPGKEHGKSDVGNLDRVWFLNTVKFFVASKSPLTEQRKSDLKLLPLWYLACIDAGEDWTKKTKADAQEHIRRVGGPWQDIESIGWK